METKTLFTIVAYSCVLLIQGLDPTGLYKNGTVDPSRRIIDGNIARPVDFRFVVVLRFETDIVPLICGGSVITNHFILTAAQCLYIQTCTTIEISPSTWERGQRSNIHPIACWPHYLFNGYDFDNDIGILETEYDLLSDERFRKIDLPQPDTEYVPGVTGVIAGWGIMGNRSWARYLMRGDVKVYSWVECNQIYKNAQFCANSMACPIDQLPFETFCMSGQLPSLPGPCLGDTGGPAIIDGLLAGVMSGIIVTSTSYCEPGLPGLMQNVAYFLPWIRSIVDPDRKRNNIPVANEYF